VEKIKEKKEKPTKIKLTEEQRKIKQQENFKNWKNQNQSHIKNRD